MYYTEFALASTSNLIVLDNQHVRLLVSVGIYQPWYDMVFFSHNKPAPAGLINPETNQRTGWMQVCTSWYIRKNGILTSLYLDYKCETSTRTQWWLRNVNNRNFIKFSFPVYKYQKYHDIAYVYMDLTYSIYVKFLVLKRILLYRLPHGDTNFQDLTVVSCGLEAIYRALCCNCILFFFLP